MNHEIESVRVGFQVWYRCKHCGEVAPKPSAVNLITLPCSKVAPSAPREETR